MANNIAEQYDYRKIDNYIKNEHSVCREERQYTLYLYNILLKCKYCEYIFERHYKDILEKCGFKMDDRIKDVFYEAAFMRDFFKRDRRCAYVDEDLLGNKLLNISCTEEKQGDTGNPGIEDTERFNYLLLKYLLGANESNEEAVSKVLKKIIGCDRSILDLNLGGKAGRGCMDKIISGTEIDNELKKEVAKARILMNVKPDIAVIFERNKGLYLKFLECKFESSEDTYDIPEYDIVMTQTKAQKLVGEFLCDSHLKIKYEKREIEWDKTELVYFRRKPKENGQKRNSQKDEQNNRIQIDKLIKLNDDIFRGTI